jgi:hypothetical protein
MVQELGDSYEEREDPDSQTAIGQKSMSGNHGNPKTYSTLKSPYRSHGFLNSPLHPASPPQTSHTV